MKPISPHAFELLGMTPNATGYEDEPLAPERHSAALDDALDFTLAPELEATEPPEARGDSRDDVRLMISSRSTPEIFHTQFSEIGAALRAGDALVINTSGVLNAALKATRADGQREIELHLSTHLPGGFWTVEPRLPQPAGSAPLSDDFAGET
ncbi:MAG: S-adenosylmethionine:tRNA ribosyltransferase-isomerase, partial [Ktedonobacterales bacterium]